MARIVLAFGGLNVEYSDLLTAYHQLLAVSRDQFLKEAGSNFVMTLYETESLEFL